MSELTDRLEALGVTCEESHASREYAACQTEDALHYCAGERLALHAASIAVCLRLPRRGAAVLSLLRRVARPRWEHYWRLQNDAFCVAALLDLSTVRVEFRKGRRWPELSTLLDHVYVMACVYRHQTLQMTAAEKHSFLELATDRLLRFQDTPEATPKDQLEVLMAIDGVRADRIDKPRFIRDVFVEPTWLDPWAMITHYDRVVALRRSPGAV
jgi:hypothetical protein